MTNRRHWGRVSSKLLPPEASLYKAMQAIIGAELRARYQLPTTIPSDLDKLLEKLDEATQKDLSGCAGAKPE